MGEGRGGRVEAGRGGRVEGRGSRVKGRGEFISLKYKKKNYFVEVTKMYIILTYF